MRTALLVALLVTAASAQTTVEGVLLAPDGTPHSYARVQFESGRVGPGVVASTETDGDGRFRIEAGGPGALGLGLGSDELWVPLVVDGAPGALDLRLTVSPPAEDPAAVTAAFGASASDPVAAALMEVYVAAERWWRTPLATPEIEVRIAQAEAAVAAAPMDRRAALDDSLRATIVPLFEAAAAPRVAAFTAAVPPDAAPLVRAGAALWGLDKVHADSAAAARVLRDVPSSSPLWSFGGTAPSAVNNVLWKMAGPLVTEGEPVPGPVERYLRALAYDHPDPGVQAPAAGVLAGVLRLAGDEDGSRAVAARLVRDHPDSRQAERVRREQGPDRRVQPGRVVPDFAYPSLDDPAVRVSAAGLRGRPVLLDFWGTWCGPCVRALPRLHALHERFHERGLEIVSVAVRDTAEEVAAFRADRFPMPWTHALHPEGSTVAAGAELEFSGVPAYVFVGPDGVVVAEGEGAFTDAVEAAVVAFFETP